MGSIVRTGGSNIDRSADLRGLSTDTKPTAANGDNVPHGSTWYNMDDCTRYMYNADNDTWYNIPNGGGGTGDMQKSVYDPTNAVANAGGIDSYVDSEIDNAITEVEGNIAPIANNLINDTVGWTNKNLLPITLDQLKAINTSGTWEDNVYTYRGITITVDIFNNLITGINVNGANTAGSVVFKLTDNFVYQLLSEDKYYISDGVDTTAIVSGSAYISVERKKGESGESHYLNTNNEERSVEFTVDYTTYDYYFVNIYIPNNSSINNAVFYPMIRRASISDDTYEPYTETVKDEIFSLNSSVGSLKSRVGIAEGNITTLNEIKANKSDLGTASTKNAISVVTDSSDLVESGAVKDIVGWGNKNKFNKEDVYNKNGNIILTQLATGIELATVTDTTWAGIIYELKLKPNKDYLFVSDVDVISGTVFLQLKHGNTIIKSSSRITEDGKLIFDFNSGEYTDVLFLNIFITDSTTVSSDIKLENVMIILASESTTAYEPYHASVEDTLRDAEVVQGKNLLDKEKALSNKTTITQTIDGIKAVVSSQTWASVYFNFDDLPQNTDLVLSDYAQISTAGNYVRLNVLGSNDNANWSNIANTQNITVSQARSLQFNTGNYSYWRIFFYISSEPASSADITFKYPMICTLEEWNKSHDYEPYYIPLKDVVPTKADNSVIAPTENGTTASQAYAVGSHAIRNGAFIIWKNAKAQGETINDASDYTSGDVADELDVVDITNEFTFAQIFTWDTSWTKIYKVGNKIKGQLRFTTPSSMDASVTLISTPEKYRTSKSSNTYLGILIEAWTGVGKGCALMSTNIYCPNTANLASSNIVTEFEYLL